MDNNNMQQITFWEFLKKHKIVIPIIQRDYAQGRIGKEKLREKFLNDLKNALDGKLDNNEKILKLDFVYGSIDNENLNPLDGQQRLTTLWLLHWYIAHKAKILKKNKDIFKNFTYETRVSSREFCEKLSEFNIENGNDEKNAIVANYEKNHCTENEEKIRKNKSKREIVELLQNQTWFYSAWKQDPTIQAMLNMLGGSDVKEKEKDILDGIEELFKSDFEKYWELLTGENCPIIFYHLPLSDLKLTDDLYIKMNARGKPLTSFENFKADMVGYIKKKIAEPDNETTWKLFDIHKFELYLDTVWTDIFWKNKSTDFKIDEIYYKFLKRYFLNTFIASSTNLTQEEIENNNTYKKLLGKDTEIYTGFEIYKQLFDKSELITSLSKILDNYSKFVQTTQNENINTLFSPNWDKASNFRFIPEYIDNNTVTTITQIQRVVFHAICCYFNKDKFNETTFKQWMRVVWNIVENANINSASAMIGALRLIDALGEHSDKIYDHLIDRNVEKDFAKEQMEEEKEKAKKIKESTAWEEKIIEAENFAFFKGAIRFLFNSEVGSLDWENFDLKFKNCQEYFDENGVKDGKYKYKTDALLLKAVISRCIDFVKYVWLDKYVFDNQATTWKYNLLLRAEWACAINDVLKGDLVIKQVNASIVFCNLFETDLLKYVAENMPGARMRWIHGHHAIYQPRKEGIILDEYYPPHNCNNRRNEILTRLLNDNLIKSDQKISYCNFFKGWDINFSLLSDTSELVFQWNSDKKIYAFKKDNRSKSGLDTSKISVETYKDLINQIETFNFEF
jgi:hypothetical protein